MDGKLDDAHLMPMCVERKAAGPSASRLSRGLTTRPRMNYQRICMLHHHHHGHYCQAGISEKCQKQAWYRHDEVSHWCCHSITCRDYGDEDGYGGSVGSELLISIRWASVLEG